MAIAPSDITAANGRSEGFLNERSVDDVAAEDSGAVEPGHGRITFVEMRASIGADLALGAPGRSTTSPAHRSGDCLQRLSPMNSLMSAANCTNDGLWIYIMCPAS